MTDVDFIKNTASDQLIKHHLKLVFTTYQQLFGQVCTGCPAKIAGYIKQIKNYKKPATMSKATANFKLKERAVITISGTNKVYSNANLTDEVAISFLKKNPNRAVLFTKVPSSLNELLNPPVVVAPEQPTVVLTDKEITLADYTVAELKSMFPEAKGRSKKQLLKNIQELEDSYTETANE